MPKTIIGAAIGAALIAATAQAQTASIMISGVGTSSNQQYSADALAQADQQAKDNASAQCVSIVTGTPGVVENLRITAHATVLERNHLFAATASALGMCQIRTTRDTTSVMSR